MQTVLIVALVMSVVLLSYHFEPVPATHEIGVPTWEQTRHVPASGIPLEEICDCITRTVSENVYFGPVGIPDNASGQPVRIFADKFLRGVVTSITASIDISHPSQGDLKIVMTAPDGTEAILHNRQGGQTTYVPKEYDSATSHALASLTGLESDGRWWLTVSDYSEGRTGSADKITITITSIPLKPEPGPVRTLSSSEGSPDSPIPDDTDGQDMSYVLDISDGGTVSDVYVLANITHAYRGDLKVILTAPDGTESVLHGRSGGGMDDLWLKIPSYDVDVLLPFEGMNATGSWVLSVGDYSPDHTGMVHDWQITVGHEKPAPKPSYPVPGRDYYREPGLAIPDDTDTQAVSSTISVPHGGALSAMYVSVDISHAYRGDLKVILTAPDGTESVLHGRSGGGQNNVASLYGSENNSDLAQLIGMDVAGEWTISVGDYRAGDTGVLNQWGMTLEYDAPV